ncbi:hypothetical protein [Paenibacillus xylanexedens]|uniref:hypothetical protein n=1 Tax=Paenibacillus xylanexedens TaxID=528191 RepID=UPI001642CA13|nr:hypothetical protein [Paenibacillus xylanexedens]
MSLKQTMDYIQKNKEQYLKNMKVAEEKERVSARSRRSQLLDSGHVLQAAKLK